MFTSLPENGECQLLKGWASLKDYVMDEVQN
jgi:hypothetical protein